MQLNTDAFLQGGKYKIIRSLGQGGFGITYEAEQVALHRRVAIKEFFMKDYCERDESTSHVTLGTSSGSKDLVEKFRTKFIREAQMIAGQDHPHIVKIYDVFEENGTAYYVMEFLEGGSLADLVQKSGPLPEAQAIDYIRQVGDALSHLHDQNCLHFDVKPSNILLNRAGKAVLIDFGISKHYDEAGSQTSSTPVGISKGYAPLEQYQQAEISTFTPATDIYALGATLYFLLTGQTPPSASEVNEDGLPALPSNVSQTVQVAIVKAMSPRRKDRPQSVTKFLSLLDTVSLDNTPLSEKDETTVLVGNSDTKSLVAKKGSDDKIPRIWLWALIVGAAAAVVIVALLLGGKGKSGNQEEALLVDSLSITTNMTPHAPSNLDSKPGALALGSIKISSTPSGAAIWLDEKNTKKTTPIILEGIAPGKHTVKLILEGYEDGSGSVTVSPGQRANLSEKLTAKPAHVPAPTQQAVELKPSVAEKPTTGTLRNHDWVDLGLPSGLKWALCNVGASSPSDCGSYFAWGETNQKGDYSWSNLKYCTDASGDHFSKYVPSDNVKYWSGGGSPDNKKRLEMADDAARANWGGSWRMPTQSEFKELIDNCTCEWITQGGKKGYKVTSKTNGNSIFLPAGGYRDGGSLYRSDSNGFYWSSFLNTDRPDHAMYLYCSMFDLGVYGNYYYRKDGLSIRPVTD